MILILDFGSQYSQLIARRVREIGVYCILKSCKISLSEIESLKPSGIILSGGPSSSIHKSAPKIPIEILTGKYPILGICYGMQAMVMQLGGSVNLANKHEYGKATTVVKKNKLFDNIQSELNVWMSHGDSVTKLPNDFTCIASSVNTPIVAISHNQKPLYGVQFHPEVTHSEQGDEILKNFALSICNCSNNWNSKNISIDIINNIKHTVNNDKVILALSGGVDSSVVAVLLNKAIGKNLTCIFVDTGLLRYKEAEQVMDIFAEHLNLNIIKIDAKTRFFTALSKIIDPEEKRKIIGNLFIKIFEEEANKIKDANWLAQGTIYPDIIESATESKNAEVIKSHHNVGGLPENMQLKIIEPIRQLFKDEVRSLGVELGLPKKMIYRHPFPGPGLALRVIGEVTREAVECVQKADKIFIDSLYKANLYDKVSQAFVVFLPVKSVGVMGDQRRHSYVLCLRAVETIDFMTAKWAKLPYDFISEVSSRIVNEVANVSRVVYDVSDKPPATIEWE